MPNTATKKRRSTQKSARRPKFKSDPSMEGNPLHAAFLDEIADVYNAEQQLLKALPRMAKAAHTNKLRSAMEAHLKETQRQIKRIDQAMKTLGETIKKKKCIGMEALLREGDEMMGDYRKLPSLDAVLIASAQKVEHYEIAAYGTLCAWAEQMGHNQALELFQENLEEEKAADEKLTNIAEGLANAEANQG